MRRGECSIAVAAKLATYAAIVQRMSEGVGMVQHFSKREGFCEALRCLSSFARQLQRVAALRVRANAGIVTAELVTEVTVAGHVVEFDTIPATLDPAHDVAPEKSRRPLAVIRFKQQVTIAGALRERDQFAGAVARQRGLASQIGVDPQAPFGLE
jgi:hypothetical protein